MREVTIGRYKHTPGRWVITLWPEGAHSGAFQVPPSWFFNTLEEALEKARTILAHEGIYSYPDPEDKQWSHPAPSR